MKNKKAIIGLGAIATLLLGVASSIAYLTDTESDVNVMTVGNVKIQQLEYERSVDDDGNWIASEYEEYGYTADLMQPYTQNKPILPAVYNDGKEKWDDRENGSHQQVWAQIGAPGSNQLFDDSVKNVVDKFVFVKNTGKKDAYYRTIVAVELPEGVSGERIHVNSTGNSRFVRKYIGLVYIEGVRYSVNEYLYNEILEPGEISRPSFLQVYLDPETTSEETEAFGDTFEILAFSQAVQADGFNDAATALDKAFGETTVSNNPWKNGVNRASEWDGEATDTTWYNDDDTEFSITSAEQLAGLAKLVNEGNNFAGKTIVLATDIDLDKEEWTPIGNDSNTFSGIFDGGNHTISNLKISNSSLDYAGLFGMTKTSGKVGSVVKNLTINNAIITGHKYTAVLAGNSGTASFDNIKVTGLVRVSGYRYVGTISGHTYGQKTNITINVKEGSFVKAYPFENGTANESNVGGAFGYIAEGSKVLVSDVTSNIDVYGAHSQVGGIAGLAQYGATLKNCVSTGNIYLDETEVESIGGIIGVWMNNSKGNVTLDNCSFTGKIFVDGVEKTSSIANEGLVNLGSNTTGGGALVIK